MRTGIALLLLLLCWAGTPAEALCFEVSSNGFFGNVKVRADGSVVAIWLVGDEVRGRFFSAEGVPIGNEFIANDTPANTSAQPQLGLASDGSFLVAYRGPIGTEGQTAIRFRRFAEDAQPLGPVYEVTPTPSGRPVRSPT